MMTATGRRWRTTPPSYVIPTSPPYNAPTYITTPTEDGSGSTVHPAVLDMGPNGWRGWRFWMAITGYWNTDDDYENPHILVSQDGIGWQPPAGLTNPVYKVTGGVFHSDTHLAYDPDTDRLWLFFRRLVLGATYEEHRQQVFLASSPDGVTWPAASAELNWTRPYGDGQVTSPAIIRRGPGDWWLFGLYHSTRQLIAYRATAPDGPWTGPTWTVGSLAAGDVPWHLDVIDDNGTFRAIVDLGPKYLPGYRDGLVAGSSRDGLNWSWSPTHLMDVSAEPAWDSGELYRTTFTRHENGTHFRVWYSANGPESWRTSYTELPCSLWPTPPA